MTTQDSGEGAALRAGVVEAVARAIVAARGQDPDERTGFVAASNPPHHTLRWEAARGEVHAAIAALKSSGLAIVPVIPSDEMATAGHMATDEVSYSDVLTIYRAMLQAAPGPT